MTTSELIAHLSEYPPDTPVVDGKGYDLKWSDISERNIDIWPNVLDANTYESPEVGIAVSIGRRF